MIIYKDLFTEDELFTDSYKIEVIDDILYHIHGKFIKESTDASNINTGANPSAEEEAEAFEEGYTTGIDVALQNRLVDSSMTKAQFKKSIKAFSKKLLERVHEKNPDRVTFLKNNMPKAVQKFIENFDDYSLYMGEKCDPEGVIVFCKFSEDCSIGSKVDVYVWKDAVIEEKQ